MTGKVPDWGGWEWARIIRRREWLACGGRTEIGRARAWRELRSWRWNGKDAAETKGAEASETCGESSDREGTKGRSHRRRQMSRAGAGTVPPQMGTQGVGSKGRTAGKSPRTEPHSAKTDSWDTQFLKAVRSGTQEIPRDLSVLGMSAALPGHLCFRVHSLVLQTGWWAGDPTRDECRSCPVWMKGRLGSGIWRILFVNFCILFSSNEFRRDK